ncbi:MAG TPA: hypothetical protein DEQ32_09360 [Gammaproteobacteria bacterium]|nr:hypothetical protein [Gammaproteobacteria bacterium]
MRCPTTSRAFITISLLSTLGCAEAVDDRVHSRQLELIDLFLNEPGFSQEKEYFEEDDAMYFFVQSTSDELGVTNGRASTTMQIGNSLLKYATTKCPTVSEFNQHFIGMTNLASRFDNDIYTELWVIPKNQIDESIAARCNH